MIESVNVNGRPAIAAYLNNQFELVDDQASASLIKLTFTDEEGGAVFLVPAAEAKTQKDWDESKHPRVPAGSSEGGQFGEGGGGGESESEASAAEPKLTPEVISVGGDEWNKATARKLERDYQIARPKVDKLATEAPEKTGATPVAPVSEGDPADEDEGEPPFEPEEWESLSNSGQSSVEEAYYDQNLQSYIDSENENYFNEQAQEDARMQVAEEFNKDKNSDDNQWAMDALNDMEQRFPFGNHELLDAITLSGDAIEGGGYGGGSYWKKHFEVEFDDEKLNAAGKAHHEGEGQEQLPGFEPPDYSKLLTKEMRDDISAALTKAFGEQAEKKAGDMEPPDYLADSAKEFMEEQWGQMSDADKFAFAKQHTDVVSDESTEGTGQYAGGATEKDKPEKIEGPIAIPKKYDPLNDTSGTDYRNTQAMARYLSVERALQVLRERKIPDIEDKSDETVRAELARIDNRLWSDWKSSSTSENGKLLQLVTAEELGGRLNYKTHPQSEIDPNDLKATANQRYDDIGGYLGLKAYLRAKWEVTQYMLDKAGLQTLHLYRGLKLTNDKLDPVRAAAVNVGEYRKAPTIKIDRNGAASTSSDNGVASGWDGDMNRVVLRAQVPRTAAVSVPAYGINIHSEHEVVIAGTAWKAWDAWIGKAPSFDEIPIGANGTGIGENAALPKAA